MPRAASADDLATVESPALRSGTVPRAARRSSRPPVPGRERATREVEVGALPREAFRSTPPPERDDATVKVHRRKTLTMGSVPEPTPDQRPTTEVAVIESPRLQRAWLPAADAPPTDVVQASAAPVPDAPVTPASVPPDPELPVDRSALLLVLGAFALLSLAAVAALLFL